MSKQKKFLLNESELPTQWYNIQAEMVNKPMPLLNPMTMKPMTPEDMYPIFCEECSRQELVAAARVSRRGASLALAR